MRCAQYSSSQTGLWIAASFSASLQAASATWWTATNRLRLAHSRRNSHSCQRFRLTTWGRRHAPQCTRPSSVHTLRLLDASDPPPVRAVGAAGPCMPASQCQRVPPTQCVPPQRRTVGSGRCVTGGTCYRVPWECVGAAPLLKTRLAVRGGPTGRPPGIQGRTSYVILPRPRLQHG